MSYPVWTPGAWIFDKNFPIAVDGVPVAQPNFTDSPTVTWTFDPNTMQVTANFANGSPASSTFVYTGTVDPSVTAGLLTGSLYLNTVSGALFQLQIVGSANTWVQIGSIIASVPVTSVFGRTGAVVPQFGDYSFSELTGSATANQIPPLSQITGSVTPSQVPTLNQIPGTITASQITGSITSAQLPSPLISSNIVSGNVNNVITVDGTTYTTLSQALSALPTAGGTIDMRGNSNAAALALGSVDPGTKAVTILLGPYSYTASQIVLKRCLQIIGSGMYASNGTTIQATGGNSTPLFILDPSNAAQSVLLQDFTVQGTAGNTSQIAFSLITPLGGGLWYSEFDRIYITGFGGMGLNLDGSSGGFNQFCDFNRVVVTRALNGSYALNVIGAANSLKFDNCEFDGMYSSQDGQTNIFIGQGSNGSLSFPPYNIAFYLVTSQFAGKGFVIQGCDTVTIEEGHFEQVEQVLTVGVGSMFGSLNVVLQNGIAGNGAGIGTASPGVGVGQGYIVNCTASAANASIGISNFHSYSTPDTLVTGTFASMAIWGLTVGIEGSYTSFPPQSRAPSGFGNGSSGTAVTTTALGTGTGPATPQTIVNYQEIWINGQNFWIPLVQ